jgi:RNA polymerase sigma factor (sigma-70 family)
MYPAAARIAWRVLRDEQGAEDAAAEACARALAQWSSLSSVSHRDAWLLRVTINIALDAARRRKRRPPVLTPDPRIDDVIVERLRIARAVRRLPRRQREVIALRYYGDLNDGEIAAKLGMATATVAVHASRALQRLRVQLNDPDPSTQEGETCRH